MKTKYVNTAYLIERKPVWLRFRYEENDEVYVKFGSHLNAGIGKLTTEEQQYIARTISFDVVTRGPEGDQMVDSITSQDAVKSAFEGIRGQSGRFNSAAKVFFHYLNMQQSKLSLQDLCISAIKKDVGLLRAYEEVGLKDSPIGRSQFNEKLGFKTMKQEKQHENYKINSADYLA